MKNFVYLSIVMMSVLAFISSCTQKEGQWDDIIELSATEVDFNSEGDSVIITTKGDWWWLSGIRLNDEQLDISEVSTELDMYTIIFDDLTINRLDKKSLSVMINKNNTGSERVLKIGFQAGNYFDNVTITQR